MQHFNFTGYPEDSTYETNKYIKYFNNLIACSTGDLLAPLVEFSIMIAAINVGLRNSEKVEGGPFGALIFDPKRKEIVSLGTNHVFLDNDPTAHAEVVAIRNFLSTGAKNLKGMHLITSCECCPMCLSYALALGVEKIYFTATHHDAASVGFSDSKQYEMFSDGYNACCTHLSHDGKIVSIDEHEYTESTFEPQIITALRLHCKQQQQFHLPENTVVKSKYKPHPASLAALDWARVGRIRDISQPNDPQYDDRKKDVESIIYGDNDFEKFGIIEPNEILHIIKNGSQNVVHIPHSASILPFKKWSEFLEKSNNANRY